MINSADVVVVGAGVIGSAVGYELARMGLRVIVVDKGAAAGQGSTSASSAVVRFSYSTFDGVAMAWESLHCWTEWADHLASDAGSPLASFRRTGSVTLDSPAIQRDRIIKLYGLVGVPFEEWDSRTLRARVPGLDPGRHWPPKRINDDAFWADAVDELGALYTPDSGFIDDPMLASQNLADAAIRQGARFAFKQSVTQVLRTETRTAGVLLSTGERITAPVVVNCAGPWSASLNAMAGVGRDFTVSVRPMRQEVHHVTAPAGYNTGDQLGPIVADLDLGTYMRPAPGNVMMIGGTEPECDPFDWLDDPDQVNPNRTPASFEAQVIRAARRFPRLQVPSQPNGIAGVYDVASDWTPIYDRTELDGFYVAIGTSGNQFKNAPIVGRMMAALITAVEHGHDHDTEPVRYPCQHTRHVVNLGTFSRKRAINTDSSRTVLG